MDMHDRRKRQRVFHVNMLKKWHQPVEATYLALEEPVQDHEIPAWNEDGGKPDVGEQLTKEQQEELKSLQRKYDSVFSELPGKTQLASHKIDTGDAPAVRLVPYRLPHAHREFVQKELKEMEGHGIIRPSSSEWAAPIVLVEKKDKSLRLCVDYRRLYSVSQTDAYPMARVDDLIDSLGKAKYISTLDLSRGYWQIAIEPQDQPKTAFTTPFGLYEFTRMPFGLQGAPATFQRMMDKLLRGLDHSGSYIYVVYSETWQEHLEDLESVLKRLLEAGLTLKPKKCQLGMDYCVYLGYVVGGGLLELNRVKSWLSRSTLDQLQRRKCVPFWASQVITGNLFLSMLHLQHL